MTRWEGFMPFREFPFGDSLLRTVLIDCSRAFARTLRLVEGRESRTTVSGGGLNTFHFTIEVSYACVGAGINGERAALDTVECPLALESFLALLSSSFAERFVSVWLLLQFDNEGTAFRTVLTDCSRALACTLRLGTEIGRAHV